MCVCVLGGGGGVCFVRSGYDLLFVRLNFGTLSPAAWCRLCQNKFS